VTSPLDASVTEGHLCVKGRFGFQFVQNRGDPTGDAVSGTIARSGGTEGPGGDRSRTALGEIAGQDTSGQRGRAEPL
jgi:hypothetical protein